MLHVEDGGAGIAVAVPVVRGSDVAGGVGAVVVLGGEAAEAAHGVAAHVELGFAKWEGGRHKLGG